MAQLPIAVLPTHRRIVAACVRAMCVDHKPKSFNMSLLDANLPKSDAKWRRPLLAYGVRYALYHALRACSEEPDHEEFDRFQVIQLSFSLQYWELRSALDFFGGFSIRYELSQMVKLASTTKYDNSTMIAPFNMPSCSDSTTLTQVRFIYPHVLRFYEETVTMWAGGADQLSRPSNIWLCALHRPGWTAENRQAIEMQKRWQKRGQYV
jgi:hypothetical protein